MTADSSTATVTHTSDDSGTGRKTLPSPWVHVVRGGIEPDSISPSPSPSPAAGDRVSVFSDPVTAAAPGDTPPDGSDGGNNCNAGGVMKSAWSKPSVNGVVEVTTSPVMGANSWPALSESTRTGVKSISGSSDSSSKQTTDGSALASVSQAPVISQPPLKQTKPNLNSHSNPNRQRSFKRGGSVGGAAAGFVRPPQPPPPGPPPLPPPFPVFDMYGNLLPTTPEPPPPPFKLNNWAPRPVDHTANRHPARRNNFSPRPFNNGYGGRRDHHGPRSPAGAARDVQIPQMAPPPPPPFRGYFPPPFLVPQPLRPYGAPMGYEMGASYVYFPTLAPAPYRGGAPVVSHGASASSMPVTAMNSSVHEEILKQIEYYFSDDNLVKDNFLRSHMEEEGCVSITLIAGFPRVQALTNDIQMLLSILKDSSIVEIQDDKVRRRADWKKWIHTPREATENLVEEASLQTLTLEDERTNEERVLANGDVSIEDHPCS